MILTAFIIAYFCDVLNWDIGIYRQAQGVQREYGFNPFLKTQK